MNERPSPIRTDAELADAAAPKRQPRVADPCAMVIFGASGDLTHRLLIPALYNLARTKLLPEKPDMSKLLTEAYLPK